MIGMAGNNSRALDSAKRNKKDEFYTQYITIEKEISRYVNYDKELFKDKVILLPCDSPEWSNFTKYFFDNFNNFGLKKIISSSYNKDGQGSYFIFDRDNIDSLKWGDFKALKLKGDGDFASEEVTSFRDEADFVITNPPFSRIKHFFPWLVEKEGLKFSFIAPVTCIEYKGIFPSFKDKEHWFGGGKDKLVREPFSVPDTYENKQTGGLGGFVTISNGTWLTNIEDGYTPEDLELNTMAHNLEHNNKLKKKPYAYKKYANSDAIEVPFVNAIPSDYDGLMGVPITFLLKNNYKQFEIVRLKKGDDNRDVNFGKDENGKKVVPYTRIIIRPIKN